MVDKVSVPVEEGLSTGKPETQEVPEGFPKKFIVDGKPDYERLAKSYTELEKQFHTPKDKVSRDNPLGEEPQEESDEGNTPEDSEGEDKPVTQEELKQALPGFTEDQLKDMSDYAWENGKLTDEQYEKLSEAGYSKQVVDQFIQGQHALLQNERTRILNAGGGEKQVEAMFDWARQNMTEDQISWYDQKFDQGGPDAIMAMENLAAKYKDSGQSVKRSTRVSGSNAPSSASEKFTSVDQVRQAMSDPRYKTDPAYRAEVEKKLANSNVL